jgi:hypothetical protein
MRTKEIKIQPIGTISNIARNKRSIHLIIVFVSETEDWPPYPKLSHESFIKSFLRRLIFGREYILSREAVISNPNISSEEKQS